MTGTDYREQVFHIAVGDGGASADCDMLGFKAWNLARMARVGLNVPPAFVLGTSWCRRWREGREVSLDSILPLHVRWLEQRTGRHFGGVRRPLMVSVRSGAPVSMPGMMDTLLDIGLCDASMEGFLRATGNPRLVWDAYRRLVRSFGEVVTRLPPDPFDALEADWVTRHGVQRTGDLDYAALRELTRESLQLYRRLSGEDFPQDPREQLFRSIIAVFESWDSERAVTYRGLNAIDDSLGTAVTVQAMVFGNGGGTSGSGVGFTRDPGNGLRGLYVDFQFNAQGEDVVSGRHAVGGGLDDLSRRMPATVRELEIIAEVLESEFGDMQEFEFTIEDGTLYILQTRSGKRTPWASLVIAVEMMEEGLLTHDAMRERLAGLDLDRISRRRSLSSSGESPLASGVGTGPGVAAGCIAVSGKGAHRLAKEGMPVILVRDDIATDEIDAISFSEGVLSKFGGRTSHAAVVARQMDKVCIVACQGLECDPENSLIKLGGHILREGDYLTLDGESGMVFAGEVASELEFPTAWLDRLRSSAAGA